MFRLTGWLLVVLILLLPVVALAQPSGPLRVYVFRTGDDASDQAALEALKERGHQVTLGVRAAHLLLADARLSDYHAVVLLGREREALPGAIVNALAGYVQSSGGLFVDGQAVYHLRSATSTLPLAAAHCAYYRHSQTTFERGDPPDAVMHDQVPSSFGIGLTAADSMTEQCLRVDGGASTFFHSRAEGEAKARPAVAGNEPGPNSRSIVFSVAIRERELRNPDLRRTFVNAVEWVGAKTHVTEPAPAAYVAQPRRIYVLRTGEDASDQAVYDALTERGHQVSMGVRVSQLSSSVSIADFEAVVALGVPREPVSTAVVGLLSRYVQAGGGLLVDGQQMYHLRGTPSITLGLPATHCAYYRHASTTVDRIEPAHGIIHDNIAPSFDLPMLELDGMTEQCLSPAAGSKMLLYSRSADGSAPRPAMLANEADQNGRIVTLAFGVRYREMREPNFRRLFVNSVEWVANSNGGPVPNLDQLSYPLKVYVLGSGDGPSDTAIQNALTERGHTVSMGVLAHQVTATTPLSDYQVIVAAGVERQAMPAAAVSSLGAYLERGGRLVLDGLLLYALRGRPVTTLNLPAEHCAYYRHRNTIYQRIDPPDPLMDTAIPPSFGVPLSEWDSMTEQCLAPVEGARLMFYSRLEDEPRPRLGVVANEPTQSSKAVQFSVAFRQRELQNPDFRRLFVNAVEYAGGKVEPPPPIRLSPDRLSFLFRNSADFARSQALRVTPTTLNPTTFTAAVTHGAEWMTVTPAAATAPADMSVRVTPVSLPPGTFTGEVTLQSGSTSIPVPVTVTVSGTAPCTYEISPSNAAVPATGGTHRIGVLTPPGCTWTAASNSPWISVVAGSSGTGAGTVSFAVAPSTSLEARTGSLTVAGHPSMVAQAGMSLSFRLESPALDLRIPEGSEEPETRIISVIPSASDAAFAASASGGSWLAVTPASGTAPGTVAVSVDSGGLAAGTYRGVVTVRIPAATPVEQTVPVTLTIEARPAPQFHIEPTSLTLSATEGSEPKTERFIVSNPGTGALTFQTAISEAPWLSVEPASGSVTTGSPASVVVTGDPRGLQPGSYSGRIVVSSSTGEEVPVNVVMTVTAARQSILLSQTGLTYTAVAQGGSVPPQNFGVLNIGSGVMDWSASASTLSGGSWLTISRTTGASAAESVDVPLIDVGVNGANLAPGEYHGRITITSPTASNSPQIVSVILNILPPGSDPGPVVRPTGLIFITQEGGPAASPQEVTISNLTSEVRQFNSNRLTTDNTVWFTHTPAQATVAPAQPSRVSVQSSGSGLNAGVRRGVLTMLFSNGSVQHVNVLNIVAPRASAAAAKEGVRLAASCSSDRLVLTHTALRPDFSISTGQGVRIDVKASDTCGNLLMPQRGATAFVSAGFSNGDPIVNLVHIGGGAWSGTWRPVHAATRVLLTITAMYLEGTAVHQKDQMTISGTVRDSSRSPIVTAGGLQHAASFEQGVPIAPGTLITLKGFNLADETAERTELPLPRELNGVEVLLGDRNLPLLYVSNNQLNVQVPFNLPANTQHQISVRRGDQLSVPESVTVTETVPGIFTAGSTGSGQGVIYRTSTGALADPGGPASAGETVVLYCTGLGAVNAPVEAGSPIPGQQPPQVPAQVQVRIGDQQAQVVFAGLTPGRPGVYEVHAIVPEGVPAGDDVPVTINAGGRTSPSVTMAVR